MDLIVAANLNNEALRMETEGNFEAAEKLHLEALEMKKKSKSATTSIVAITENGLGELYLKMGKFDDAEKLLESAYNNRSHKVADGFDKTCTADNLGRLFESRGDLEKASTWRQANGPNRMICSHFECPKSKLCAYSTLAQLKKCGRCGCVFYCNKECQKQDWGRHKAFCKAPVADATN